MTQRTDITLKVQQHREVTALRTEKSSKVKVLFVTFVEDVP